MKGWDEGPREQALNFHQTAVSWLTAMNTSQYMHLNFVLLSVIIQFATCLQIEKHTGSGQKFGCTKIHKLTCALFKTRSKFNFFSQGVLTLCLLVSAADNLCKQYVTRSVPTKR